MKKIILTIIINLWIPISVGVAQNRDLLVDSVMANRKLRMENDSLKAQVNLNLDLISYRISKDSMKQAQIDTTTK